MKSLQQSCQRFYAVASAGLTLLVINACSANDVAQSGSSPTAEAAKVAMTVTDTGCQPIQISVVAGKSMFVVTNQSSRVLEWEILKDGTVVAEQENIVPGFVQQIKANLEPGDYQMTCGLRSNPKGKVVVNAK